MGQELPRGGGLAAKFIATSGALDSPFILIDIGVRGGIHPRWRALEPAMRVYGFDAIAELPPPNERHRYFKLALGDFDGEASFHVPENAYEARISPDGDYKVPIARLDTLWTKGIVPAPDFIKIDCEGHEPEILSGAEQCLRASDLLGADIETNFHVSPTLPLSHFAAVNAPLAAQRLLVAEFAFGAARRLPWNGTCNAFFSRHLLNERDHPERYPMRPAELNPSPDTILKTVAVLDVYGLTGPAIALTVEFRRALESRIDVDRLAKLLARSRWLGIFEQCLPHLNLGIWTVTKRVLGRTPRVSAGASR